MNFEKNFMSNKFEGVAEKDEPKEFTEDELFKIALRHIESETNLGDSAEKASTKKLVGEELAGHKGSFIEESIKKAHEMVANGEAEKIARQEYRGGLEAPRKPYNESEEDEEDEN